MVAARGFFYEDRSALMRTATLRIAARWALKVARTDWCRNAPGCGLRMVGPARHGPQAGRLNDDRFGMLCRLEIEERSGR